METVGAQPPDDDQLNSEPISQREEAEVTILPAPEDAKLKDHEDTSERTEEPAQSRSDSEKPGDSTQVTERSVDGTEKSKVTKDDDKEVSLPEEGAVGGSGTVQPPAAPDGTSVVLTAATEYECYSPSSKQQCWAVTSLKAPKYEPSARASVDIVAVIDKSGSMGGQKIALVRKTLEFVIEQLKETDRISLVVYDTDVELVFGLMKMTEQNKESARKYVSSITDGSCTNLSGGLFKGMEQVVLTNGEEKAQVQSVLLLTDGLANDGITHKEGIIEQMKKMQGLEAVAMSSMGSDVHSFHRDPWKAPPSTQSSSGSFFAPLFGWNKKPEVEISEESDAYVAMPITTKDCEAKKVTYVGDWHTGKPEVEMSEESDAYVTMPIITKDCEAKKVTYVDDWHTGKPEVEMSEESDAYVAMPITMKDCEAKKFDGTVYTFGFGSDHDADMLEAISTQGGGMYYYINSNEKIPESFADCLGGLLSVVGQNVSVKLQAQGDTCFNKVHTSKNITWTKKNKSCEIALGDIQSEEGRDLVLELELPPVPSGTASENVPLVSVELSYFNVITSQLDTVQCQLTTDRIDGAQGQGNMTVDIQRNRVLAAAALKEAEELASQVNDPLTNQLMLTDTPPLSTGDSLLVAQECLKKTVAKLEESLSKDNDLVKLLVVDLKKSIDTMKDRATFMSYGKNWVRSKQQSHAVQRTNYVEDFDDEVVSCGYMNISRMAYRSEASSKKSGWF